MPTTYRPYRPDQSFLLPPSPKDWLAEDHLVYFISETVDRMDLSRFYGRYEGDGRRNRPFDPRMMVKVLLYGYATGTFSSRKLAKKLEEDVALRVVAAGNFPAHRTICEFRQRHLKEFQELFIELVRIAREAGMIRLGTVAVDGAKVKANASKRKAMSYQRMKKEDERLRQEIEQLTEEARRVDAEEDRIYGEDQRGDELPEDLRRREDRLAKIEAAMERLKARQAEEDRRKGRHEGDNRKSPRGGWKFKREFGEPKEKAQDNFTDPDSRIMMSKGSFQQCYNSQIAVDEGSQLVVATGVTQSAGDNPQLLKLVDQTEKNMRRRPQRLLADAGYRDEDSFRVLEKKGIEAYISLGREDKKAAQEPTPELPASWRMHEKLKTEAGRAQYKRRKAIVEPVFGWVKQVLGFRRFSLRGIEKVSGEWDLVCLAVNLKRMNSLIRWV
jgi:transposase